jgi:hypothetical protein
MVFIKFVVIGSDPIEFIQDNNKIIDDVTQHIKSFVECVEVVETHFNANLKIGIVEIVAQRPFYDVVDLVLSIGSCQYTIQFI